MLSVRPSHNGIWIVALPFEVLPIWSHQLLNVLNNQVNCHCNSQETNMQQFNSAWEKTAIAPECTVNICREPFLKHHFQQTCVGCLSSATNPICLLSPQKCSGPHSVSEYTHERTKNADLPQVCQWALFCFRVHTWKNKTADFTRVYQWASEQTLLISHKCRGPHSVSK